MKNSEKSVLVITIIIILISYGVGIIVGRSSKTCSGCTDVTKQVQDFRLGNVLLGQKPIPNGADQVFYKDQYYDNSEEIKEYSLNKPSPPINMISTAELESFNGRSVWAPFLGIGINRVSKLAPPKPIKICVGHRGLHLKQLLWE